MADTVVVTQAPNPIIVVSSPGPIGPAGAAGAAGVGVPVGGTTGQVLSKIDGTNYNTEWSTAAAGYSAPTLGSTLIPSGTTVTTIASLTLTAPAINTITASASNASPTLYSITTNGNATFLNGQTTGNTSISNGATFSGTLNLANGAGTVSKTINIGASSTAGTTTINIGSTAGATSNVTISGTAIPASATLTKTTDKLSVFAATTSAEFASVISDEIGTGNVQLSDLATSAQTASYTLVLADRGKLVEMSNAAANNLTVPLNSTAAYPIGTQINILQTGAGQTTVVATGGVTINATPGLKLRAQWSSATLIKRGTDTWVLVGDLSA
jgi:hypothetical protein